MEPTFSAANIIYLFYLETRLSFWRLFIFWIWSNLFESEEFFEAEGFNLAAGYFESRSFKKFWRLKKIAEDSKHQKVVIKKAWSRDKISKWYSLLKKEVPLKFKIIFFWYALLFDFNFVLNDIWSEWMLWKKAWFWLACICSSSQERFAMFRTFPPFLSTSTLPFHVRYRREEGRPPIAFAGALLFLKQRAAECCA